MSVKTFLKDRDNVKSCLWVLTALILVFGTIFFPGFSDYANKPFWWKFWDILGISCGVLCVAGWVYLWVTNKPKPRE